MSFILLFADPLFHLLFLLIFTPFSISVSVSLARNRGDRESCIYIPFTIKHCLLSAAVYKLSIISDGYTCTVIGLYQSPTYYRLIDDSERPYEPIKHRNNGRRSTEDTSPRPSCLRTGLHSSTNDRRRLSRSDIPLR
ncbi:hypothetical protein M434DRAFT_307489 [Hypoxylon sp. CO27-5]|nr:hypothetical protein M434DRAFT_307489 [Hypoxylon sp. CO27-5]